MRGTWENHERLRCDLFKLLGITFCTPFCALILDQFVHGLNFSGDFIPRLIMSIWLLGEGARHFEQALKIALIMDKRINLLC